MTVAEVAEFLQLAERTVLRMAQRGEIPAAKVASQWRFMRSMVREWLLARTRASAGPGEPASGPSGTPDDSLTKIFRPELIRTDIQPGPKAAVLAQLVQPLRETGFARDSARLLETLARREQLMTTGVGESIAIPHPRTPIEGMFPAPAVALGVCREGTDFDAIDGEPVRVLFLICAPREDTHLRLMARVFWLARQGGAIEQLTAARGPQDVHDALEQFETRPGRDDRSEI